MTSPIHKPDQKEYIRDACSVRTSFFVVKCRKSEKSNILSAISKKKVANAVERNTIKRRIRAAFARFRPYSLTITIQPINVTGATPYSAYEAAADALTSSCSKLLNSKK